MTTLGAGDVEMELQACRLALVRGRRQVRSVAAGREFAARSRALHDDGGLNSPVCLLYTSPSPRD
eukprot:12957923-Alexandrium_andersonii.AAC.1